VVTDNEVIGVLTSTPLLIRLALPLIDNPFLAAMFAVPFLATIFMGELSNFLALLRRHLSREPSAQISEEKRFKIAF
jgi:hypothetical protein